MAETKVSEQTEVEKAKTKWTDGYKKDEAGTMFDALAYINARLADMDAKLDQMNPQATTQRNVAILSNVVADVARRLAELEKTR